LTGACFLTVVLSSSAASAQQSRTSPYARLFEPGDLKTAAVQQQVRQAVQQAQAQQRPRVVCGMTMIPADPKIDSKMIIEVPRRDDVRHTIRAIEPTTCWIPESERK
jgi:hypothetical protein